MVPQIEVGEPSSQSQDPQAPDPQAPGQQLLDLVARRTEIDLIVEHALQRHPPRSIAMITVAKPVLGRPMPGRPPGAYPPAGCAFFDLLAETHDRRRSFAV